MQAHSVSFSEGSSLVKVILKKNNKSLNLNCSPDQYLGGLKAYKAEALIQDAFHFLNPNEREFLVSGLTSEEFDKLFACG